MVNKLVRSPLTQIKSCLGRSPSIELTAGLDKIPNIEIIDVDANY
ncbi:MAG: hypothetical protein ACRC62_19850 [Microcoleus sp.]